MKCGGGGGGSGGGGGGGGGEILCETKKWAGGGIANLWIVSKARNCIDPSL